LDPIRAGRHVQFALTAQKFGIAQSEFPKTWQSIEAAPVSNLGGEAICSASAKLHDSREE